MRRTAIMLVSLGLTGVACEQPERLVATTTASTDSAPTTASQKEEEQPAAAAADPYASMKEGEWCPAAYSDTVKIVEAMKATMKKAGVEDGPNDYTPPNEARYIELCGKLPGPMQNCLVVGYAARNRDDCQSALNGLDADAKAAYAELMGK